jgi:Holliday junction resolvase RusA-like endonuclease
MINHPVNVKALYYVELHGNSKVDISNLHNALHDILVKYRVLADDESRIVAGTDGSRVIIVSNNPRTEVFIEDMPEALP